jgi:hypothetical protein
MIKVRNEIDFSALLRTHNFHFNGITVEPFSCTINVASKQPEEKIKFLQLCNEVGLTALPNEENPNLIMISIADL